jgi:hypothetical protein
MNDLSLTEIVSEPRPQLALAQRKRILSPTQRRKPLKKRGSSDERKGSGFQRPITAAFRNSANISRRPRNPTCRTRNFTPFHPIQKTRSHLEKIYFSFTCHTFLPTHPEIKNPYATLN